MVLSSAVYIGITRELTFICKEVIMNDKKIYFSLKAA